jgi:Uma2 family endonuclease
MSIPTKTGQEVEQEPFYPSEDGEPMAETPIHVLAIMLLFQALQDFFRARPDVYIASNMFWYWQEGNPDARRAPDVMVIPGVGQADRRSFFSWKENGAIPAVIFEITSEKNWQENWLDKRELYEELGVKEYFLFDPEAAHLRPPLQGFRLGKRGYRTLRHAEEGSLTSPELGLQLLAEGRMLRLIDTRTRERIHTREERIAQERQNAEESRRRAMEAEQRAQTLEAENARLRALLEKPRNGNPP